MTFLEFDYEKEELDDLEDIYEVEVESEMTNV